ncbi:hypothetical protein GGI42DRAFT_231364 [Trichoderma sp. SZMC 28013]
MDAELVRIIPAILSTGRGGKSLKLFSPQNEKAAAINGRWNKVRNKPDNFFSFSFFLFMVFLVWLEGLFPLGQGTDAQLNLFLRFPPPCVWADGAKPAPRRILAPWPAIPRAWSLENESPSSAPNMARTEQAASRRWIISVTRQSGIQGGQRVDKAFGEQQLIVRCGVRVRATRVRVCTVYRSRRLREAECLLGGREASKS